MCGRGSAIPMRARASSYSLPLSLSFLSLADTETVIGRHEVSRYTSGSDIRC